eukprot:snap_masked-scaffold_8-processed-gene-5.15-mRNA-1 protein AED:1.00 eAED:1.00 QI:0/-1/0/0/-1/1/1/0/200
MPSYVSLYNNTSIIHAKVPNSILHTDYLYVLNDYVLVITDDLSRKVLLRYSKKADLENVVKTLIQWKPTCRLPEYFTLYSDQGAHFANRLVKELVEEFRGSNRTSIVYAPWTNSGAERTTRVILSSMRSLCSELLWDPEKWYELQPLIECYMNNRIRENLDLTPNEIFLGQRIKSPLMPTPAGAPSNSDSVAVLTWKGKK